jgi:hypothetical protein
VVLGDFRLTDQAAIVTGGEAGIGRATAVALAEPRAHAGGAAPRPWMDTSSEYFSPALHVNTTAPFVLSRTATQAMDFVMNNDALRTAPALINPVLPPQPQPR